MSVKIYTTPSCGYCGVAKRYLKEKGVTFTEYNVARDPSKADEMIRRSGQSGVPVIDIHGKMIVGFDRSAIDRALG